LAVPGFLRLFRISIAFTPAADVTLGYACALAWQSDRGLDIVVLLTGCLVSSLIFGSAVAVNDIVDEEKDGRTAPGRPIPSGAITPALAKRMAVGTALSALILAGTLGLSALVAAAVVMALTASYNLLTRSNRWLGVGNLALIRAVDFGFGMVCAGGFGALADLLPEFRWAIPVLYGLYALSLSGVALGERLDRPSHSMTLFFSLIAAASAGCFLWFALRSSPHFWPPTITLVILLSPLCVRLLRPTGAVEPIVGHLVSGYLLMAAIPVHALLSPVAGWTLVALFFLSRAMSRFFPPA